ncbi:unnamed protein product [Chondrus crispus]|uniref:Uncharacterized protein n=1 Tax=Chondrus crispus TaxID=2769 RepID=R7Q7I5_CHOCR|nr:unnamed protein product [Chondrus crispus]CDF33803.1 unnamed protein product [Chondrus crispus]|eukprot:XP_005713621.1 unnamed protein product [Chondrus crispus]
MPAARRCRSRRPARSRDSCASGASAARAAADAGEGGGGMRWTHRMRSASSAGGAWRGGRRKPERTGRAGGRDEQMSWLLRGSYVGLVSGEGRCMKDREVFIPGVPQETLADVRVGL